MAFVTFAAARRDPDLLAAVPHEADLEELAKAEIDGASPTWARWAPGTGPGVGTSGNLNLQIDIDNFHGG